MDPLGSIGDTTDAALVTAASAIRAQRAYLYLPRSADGPLELVSCSPSRDCPKSAQSQADRLQRSPVGDVCRRGTAIFVTDCRRDMSVFAQVSAVLGPVDAMAILPVRPFGLLGGALVLQFKDGNALPPIEFAQFAADFVNGACERSHLLNWLQGSAWRDAAFQLVLSGLHDFHTLVAGMSGAVALLDYGITDNEPGGRDSAGDRRNRDAVAALREMMDRMAIVVEHWRTVAQLPVARRNHIAKGEAESVAVATLSRFMNRSGLTVDFVDQADRVAISRDVDWLYAFVMMSLVALCRVLPESPNAASVRMSVTITQLRELEDRPGTAISIKIRPLSPDAAARLAHACDPVGVRSDSWPDSSLSRAAMLLHLLGGRIKATQVTQEGSIDVLIELPPTNE